MATAEELMIVRNIRRDLNKLSLDSTRMEISINKGIVYLSGIVSGSREEAIPIPVKPELEEFILKMTKMPGIKQVVNGCKIVERKIMRTAPAPRSL